MSLALSTHPMPRFEEPADRPSTGPDSFECDIDITVDQGTGPSRVELFPLYDYRADISEEEGSFTVGTIYVCRHDVVNSWHELDETTPTGKFIAALIRAEMHSSGGQERLYDRQQELA